MTAEVLEQPKITEPGVYADIPASEYHADPVAGGSLSSTGARKLVPPSTPARYRYDVDHPTESTTEALNFGILAHAIVLGADEERIVEVQADDWRTKIAKETRAAAQADGKTAVLSKDMEKARAMAAALDEHEDARQLLRAAATEKPEQTMIWQDKSTGVWCRSRLDYFHGRTDTRRLIVVDYKSCVDASPDAFGTAAADHGYHQQDDWYRTGVRTLGLDDDPAFVFVAQEKKPPFLVNVVELDDAALAIGRSLNRIALGRYAECRRTGRWPGYGRGVSLVSLPAWYERRHDENGN